MQNDIKYIISDMTERPVERKSTGTVARGSESILLHPNTGHHYFAVFFDRKPAQSADTPATHIKSISRQKSPAALLPFMLDDDPLLTTRDMEAFGEGRTKWQTQEDYPWIRFRPALLPFKGSGEKKGPCFLICIDTNIGDNTRGAILFESAGGEPAPADENARAPYAWRSQQVDMAPRTLFVGFKNDIGEASGVVLDIEWASSANQPVEVDLLVDFGNTRTVAALLERPNLQAGFFMDKIKGAIFPVHFASRDHKASIGERPPDTIIDSWFMLHETQFAGVEFCDEGHAGENPATVSSLGQLMRMAGDMHLLVSENIPLEDYPYNKKRHRTPQMFVEQAPLMVGEPAKEALATYASDLITEPVILSSPKRYSWDGAPRDSSWSMIKNNWNIGKDMRKHQNLQGSVLRFLHADGPPDWRVDRNTGALVPPNEEPVGDAPLPAPLVARHPRRDMLTLSALNVIEHAHLLMSARTRKALPAARRKLRAVRVTYPAGWTFDELVSYKQCWKRAIDIFSLNNLEDWWHSRPELIMDLDEAVATQLPIVYDSLLTMGSFTKEWLDLYGKTASGGNPDNPGKTVRVMTFDIGGGTSDCAVVEYKQSASHLVLEHSVLMKDSTQDAGDKVVRALIESVILPLLMRAANMKDMKDLDLFKKFWKGEIEINNKPVNAKRSYLTRALLIPLVEHMLANMDKTPGEIDSLRDDHWKTPLGQMDELWKDARLEAGLDEAPGGLFMDCAAEINTMLRNLLEDKGFAQPDYAGAVINKKRVVDIIQGVLVNSMEFLKTYADLFKVDLLILSGKPSELQCVQDLLPRYVSMLPPSRRIRAKGRRVGEWYPFARLGAIADAKNVNIVGLALHSLTRAGLMDGVRIKQAREPATQSNFCNEWIARGTGREPQKLEFDKDGRQAEPVTMCANDRIFRKMRGSEVYTPVYQLITENRDGRKTESADPVQFQVTVRRVVEQLQEQHLERLADAKICKAGGKPPDPGANVGLRLCMLESNTYWIDEAVFTI